MPEYIARISYGKDSLKMHDKWNVNSYDWKVGRETSTELTRHRRGGQTDG